MWGAGVAIFAAGTLATMAGIDRESLSPFTQELLNDLSRTGRSRGKYGNCVVNVTREDISFGYRVRLSCNDYHTEAIVPDPVYISQLLPSMQEDLQRAIDKDRREAQARAHDYSKAHGPGEIKYVGGYPEVAARERAHKELMARDKAVGVSTHSVKGYDDTSAPGIYRIKIPEEATRKEGFAHIKAEAEDFRSELSIREELQQETDEWLAEARN